MSDCQIICKKNGSYRISGSFVIQDAAGNDFDLSGRDSISLCRCGHSSSKPFCDGTHRAAGFQSEVQARKLPPPASKA